jgi:hypothetical protein
VASLYRVIDDDTQAVLVDSEAESDPAARAIATVVGSKGFATRDDWSILQQYSVSLRRREIEKLPSSLLDLDWVPGLHRWRGYYHPMLGMGETVQFAVEDLILGDEL